MKQSTSLKFNPNIAAAPIYTSDTAVEAAQKAYGLEEIALIGSNESPLGPSPRAVAAMQQAAAGLNRYPPLGDEELRATLAETIGRGLEPDNFVTSNGGTNILAMLATCFLSPGDEAIICRPTFPIYELTARRTGANIVYADLEPEQFSYNVEAILAAVTDRTRLIYICNPNNPTGGTLTAGQMETLVDNVPPHLLIVADEVYHDFVTRPDFPDSLAYVDQGRNVIVIHSFSKAHSLAGLRLGYGIAPAEIARYLSRARSSFHLGTVTLAGGLASLEDSAHLKECVAVTLAGRDWLYEELKGLGLRVWASQGNFILFKPPFPPAQLSERLLRRGLLVRPMTLFYLPTYMRVSVGLPEENERFITALGLSLAEMEAEGVPKDVAVDEDGGEFKF